MARSKGLVRFTQVDAHGFEEIESELWTFKGHSSRQYRSGEVHPGGRRWDFVVADDSEHVPTGWGQCRAGGRGDLELATALSGDRQVDQALVAVEGVGGHAGADQLGPQQAAGLGRVDRDRGRVLPVLGRSGDLRSRAAEQVGRPVYLEP